MKTYYITLGSFRNIIIQSELDLVDVMAHVKTLGWKTWNVQRLEPGTLQDLPIHPELKKIMES